MEKIQVLEHNATRVLTTKQLAEFYGTEPRTISDNFNRNQERFTEGKHFFVLQGEEKRNFINQTLIADGSVKAEKFYLWTEKGAARHAKILSTDKAWDIFEELEDTYFRVQEARVALEAFEARRSTNRLTYQNQQNWTPDVPAQIAQILHDLSKKPLEHPHHSPETQMAMWSSVMDGYISLTREMTALRSETAKENTTRIEERITRIEHRIDALERLVTPLSAALKKAFAEAL